MSGQSIMDRMAAAKHSIAGQGLAKSVCKATTEEIIGPKKKHLDYLLQCTNEPNVSIPQLADLLIERTQHSNWVVVFKSLITIHNLVNYGNERFTQYLASNNCSFNLSGFVDKAGVQGYDMSTFIRRYAKYMNEKAVSYRQMAFDFCKVKRGKDDGLLRTMNAEKLLKALPVLQAQLDALLEFDCTPNELTNGVINAAFMLLFKDLIRLFACYNDGVINLLEKYFDMNKKQCKDALDLYKKFLVRMEKVSEFLKVAENVGIDKGDIPDLAKGLKNQSSSAPASLLEALEQHLASLEGKKGGAAPVTSSAKPAGFSSALNTMTTNSSAFNISETEKKKILEEESRYLQQLKPTDSEPTAAEPGLDLLASEADDTSVVNAEAGVKEEGDEAYMEETAGLREGLELIEQRLKELTGTPASANNPFASSASPPASSPTAAAPAANAGARPSDDLLGLNNNPFADNVQSVMASAYNSQPPAPTASNNPFGAPAPAFQQQQTNGFAAGASSGNNFTSDADFARAFNSSSTASPAVMSFGTPTVSAIPNAPPALDLGSPLDPLEPTTPQRSSGFGTVEPPPLSLSQPAELLGQAPSPCPSPVPPPASPSQPMAIPGAFGGGGGMSGLAGLSSSPMPGGLSSSPMAGGMSSSPMAGGLSSSPMTGGMSSSPMAGGLSSSPMGGGGGGFSSMGAGFSSSPMHGGYSSSPMGGGGFSAMGEGISSNLMGGSYSSSPMGGGLASSPMPGGMSSNPMSAFSSGFGSQSGGMGMGMSGGGGPFSQLGVGPSSMGLSSSPTGPPGLADLHIPSSPARHLSRSPSPTMPDAGSFGRSSPSPGMGVEQHPPTASATGFDAFGDVLQPANAGGTVQGPGMTKAPEPKLLASDLDTSLASLASNLSVKSPADQVKKTSHQWQPKGESKLTGGNTYQQRPVIQSSATTWSTPQQPQFQPGMQPQMMGAPGMGFGQPQMVGAMGPQPMMGMGPGMGMGQMRPGMGGMPAMGMQQPMMYGGMGGMPAARMPQQQGQGQNPHNDPFGAL